MHWVTINRVPELYAALQIEAESRGEPKPSMKRIAEEAGIDYSVAYNWFKGRVTYFDGSVASRWAAYFGEPVLIQRPE